MSGISDDGHDPNEHMSETKQLPYAARSLSGSSEMQFGREACVLFIRFCRTCIKEQIPCLQNGDRGRTEILDNYIKRNGGGQECPFPWQLI